MNTNTSEQENTVENVKKGTQRGHKTSVSTFSTSSTSTLFDQNRDKRDETLVAFPTPHAKGKSDRTDRTPRAGRDSVAYWRAKVRPRLVRGFPTPELYARFKEAGRDAWICLDTSNTATAAAKARDLYLRMKAIGLPALLAELRPEVRPERCATVGEYLEAAKALSTVRPATLAEYEASLRRVVAGVRGIAPKSDRHADRAEWRTRVDALRLDKITPAEVKVWKKRELDKALAEGGEIAKDRREHTLASHIRDARALFSAELVAELAKRLTLPSPLPLDGIEAAATTRRFTCDLDPRALYQAADALDADTRTAFDLLLCAGLRRGEADALPWAHVDLKAGTVTVDVTPTFRPKSRESVRTVPIPPDVVARLRVRRAAMPDAELVLEAAPTKPARKAAGEKRAGYEYRAKAWPALTKWLKTQGMRDLTPLHALRKLSGSFVYSVAGLEAARRHLGHRDVTTTAASYVTARAAVVDLAAPPPAKRPARR